MAIGLVFIESSAMCLCPRETAFKGKKCRKDEEKRQKERKFGKRKTKNLDVVKRFISFKSRTEGVVNETMSI